MTGRFDERGFIEALERAQADERLPAWTMVRDLGWPDYESRRFEIWTAYAPPLIADGRSHDHLVTPTSLSGGWQGERLAEIIGRTVDRHLEEWRLLVEHADAQPVRCRRIRPFAKGEAS